MGLDDRVASYIASINTKACPDSKDTMLQNLMHFHDEVKELQYDEQRVRLGAMIIRAADALLEDTEDPSAADATATATPPTDNPPVDQTCEETYANEDADTSAWAVEQVPKLSFDDVVGAEDAVEVIREAIIMPLMYPSLFQRAQATPWRGALLYGPPGTGKSLLARTAASEAGVAFFNACCADLTSKFVGGSEKLVRSLFQRARDVAPSIVFLDEIDSIASTRETDKSVADQRLTNQLLVEIDRNGMAERPVFTLAATNLPWVIDAAVMRRLAKKIYVKLPAEQHRKLMLQKTLPEGMGISETHLQLLADSCTGFSGSDLVSYANDLKMQPLRSLMKAASFRVCRGDDQAVREVHARLPGEAGEASDEPGTLQGVIEKYTEDKIVIPKIAFEQAMTSLQEFKKHVKTGDVAKYERFQTS